MAPCAPALTADSDGRPEGARQQPAPAAAGKRRRACGFVPS
jgi:hypothetical protein